MTEHGPDNEQKEQKEIGFSGLFGCGLCGALYEMQNAPADELVCVSCDLPLEHISHQGVGTEPLQIKGRR